VVFGNILSTSVTVPSSVSTPTIQQQGPDSSRPPPLKRFKFLAQSLQSSTPISANPECTAADELADYINGMPYDVDDSLTWWLKRTRDSEKNKKLLPPLAIDILAAPSSEAFVERVFSLCGDFTTGKRNRCLQSLERKVFLRLNKKFIP
jgi:hypothetical protein